MTVNTIVREEIQETDRIAVTSPMMYARAAGILYLVITVAAMIAHFYVPSTLIVPDDAAATANNIMTSESLFRFGGIGGELVILLSEIALSIILYVLLKPVSHMLSLIAAVSRLIMTAIHGINLLNYFFVILILTDSAYVSAFDVDQRQALVSLFLDAHHYGFEIGIAFLTLHVFILGYLIYKSGYIPRILGILFLIAAVGYLIDSMGILLVSGYELPGIIALPIAVAEIAFPLWLLIKGVNVEQWTKRTRGSLDLG